MQAEPAQSFSADFDLQGDVKAGLLTFFTPLGTTVARLQWSRDGAYLQASGETLHFESLDALTLHATGTVLPVAGLFAWLKGEQPDTPGWLADLQDLPNGRLTARRAFPEPTAQLKIILER